MERRRAEDVEWADAPAENFTGRVRFGPLSDQGPLNALAVRFEAEARTDWHSHPEGQVLYVLEGRGRIQDDDGTTEEFEKGDVIYTPPRQIHWHGAGPDGPMTHISLTTGGDTIWEPRKVTNQEYNRSDPITIPTQKDVMFTILQALSAMGGFGRAKDVVAMVARLIGLTDEQRMPKTKSGPSKFDIRVKWASDALKNIGCLSKENRNWILTAKGNEYIRRSQQEPPKTLNEELNRLTQEYHKEKTSQ